MSSPATTCISFQPTDTAVKDKRQTNLTSVGKKQNKTTATKEPLSFVNMNTETETTKDNVIDVML